VCVCVLFQVKYCLDGSNKIVHSKKKIQSFTFMLSFMLSCYLHVVINLYDLLWIFFRKITIKKLFWTQFTVWTKNYDIFYTKKDRHSGLRVSK